MSESATVASGGSHVVNVNGFVIPADASDPYSNTASVSCSPVGFPNVYDDSDSWDVNLFQPSVDVAKICYDASAGPGNTVVVHGDPLEYQFTITNTGSADAPNLALVSVLDVVTVGSAPSLPAADLTSYNFV